MIDAIAKLFRSHPVEATAIGIEALLILFFVVLFAATAVEGLVHLVKTAPSRRRLVTERTTP